MKDDHTVRTEGRQMIDVNRWKIAKETTKKEIHQKRENLNEEKIMKTPQMISQEIVFQNEVN